MSEMWNRSTELNSDKPGKISQKEADDIYNMNRYQCIERLRAHLLKIKRFELTEKGKICKGSNFHIHPLISFAQESCPVCNLRNRINDKLTKFVHWKEGGEKIDDQRRSVIENTYTEEGEEEKTDTDIVITDTEEILKGFLIYDMVVYDPLEEIFDELEKKEEEDDRKQQ